MVEPTRNDQSTQQLERSTLNPSNQPDVTQSNVYRVVGLSPKRETPLKDMLLIDQPRLKIVQGKSK